MRWCLFLLTCLLFFPHQCVVLDLPCRTSPQPYRTAGENPPVSEHPLLPGPWAFSFSAPLPALSLALAHPCFLPKSGSDTRGVSVCNYCCMAEEGVNNLTAWRPRYACVNTHVPEPFCSMSAHPVFRARAEQENHCDGVGNVGGTHAMRRGAPTAQRKRTCIEHEYEHACGRSIQQTCVEPGP